MTTTSTASNDLPARRRDRLGLALLACAAWAGVAQAEDLPGSSACRVALEALDRAERAIVAARAASAASAASAAGGERQRPAAEQLLPLRQRVADVCLGGLTRSPPPSQHTWVSPPPVRPETSPLRARTPALPLPAVTLPRVEVPVTVSNCNAATCLGSDGSTLTRVGPNLVGPRGVCTVQGVFLHCP